MIEDLAVRELATPAQRVYWAAYLVSMVVCQRQRIPLVPSFIMSVLAAQGVRKAWAAAADLRRLADAAEQLADCGAAGPVHAV